MRRILGLALVFNCALASATAQNDGPYLFHQKSGAVEARWVVDGKLHTETFAKGKPIVLPKFEHLLGKQVELTKHEPQPAIWEQPNKLLVISDVEGEYDAMLRFLRGNGVVDENGRWTYGKGHLLTIGDMVDRGQQQTEVLWMLWRLQREAESAGGQLHFVLGNHEVMLMGGDVRYTAPKYHDVAKLMKLPVEGLVGADTELGRWLRQRNILVRIGPWLFVHAGISPAFADKKIDLDERNRLMRKHVGTHITKLPNALSAAWLWSVPGPLWYRGYFAQYPEFGPVPTVTQIDKILERLGAETIVIGHTKVDKIAPMFGKRRVLPIDIPWTNVELVRGLLIEGEKVAVVDHLGKQTPLE